MKIYLASIATSEYPIERKVYKSLGNSLKYIYDNLKSLSMKCIDGCDFFDRDYVQQYFTEDFFTQFGSGSKKMNCNSTYGEFFIEKMSDSKYMFVFTPFISMRLQNPFIVCELEILELL
jgi:hypothetical protein